MNEHALADLILRIVPNYADLSLVEVVECVRYHIGGCAAIAVEDALDLLNEGE